MPRLTTISNVLETLKSQKQFVNEALDNGAYIGKLCMVRISKQSQRFVKEGEKPKDMISFVFDIEGRLISTKAFGLSWAEKSSLPKFFKMSKAKNLAEFDAWLDKKLAATDGTFELVIGRNDAGYNTIDMVMSEKTTTEAKGCKIPKFFKKVFGEECVEYALADGYSIAD